MLGIAHRLCIQNFMTKFPPVPILSQFKDEIGTLKNYKFSYVGQQFWGLSQIFIKKSKSNFKKMIIIKVDGDNPQAMHTKFHKDIPTSSNFIAVQS